jgi:transposase
VLWILSRCSYTGRMERKPLQYVTGEAVEIAYVDQGYTGEQAAQDAAAHHIQLEVVKRPEVKKEFVLLPKRRVIERSNAWAARFRRLARDYEQLAKTLKGLHFVACAILLLKRFVEVIVSSA